MRTRHLILAVLLCAVVGCKPDQLADAILKVGALPIVQPAGFLPVNDGRSYQLAAVIANRGFDNSTGSFDVEMEVFPIDALCLVGDEVLQNRITLPATTSIPGSSVQSPGGGAITTPSMIFFKLHNYDSNQIDCGLSKKFHLKIVVDPDGTKFGYLDLDMRTFVATVHLP